VPKACGASQRAHQQEREAGTSGLVQDALPLADATDSGETAQRVRGVGWLTNPRKAAYNRIYHRTTRDCLVVLMVLAGVVVIGGIAVATLVMA
jgi:hypothetical protein